VTDYPLALVPVNHVEPVPRRIRAFAGGELILDTTRDRYVWEWPGYPQYYIPRADVRDDLLVDEGTIQQTRRGPARVFGIKAGTAERPGAARLLEQSPVDGLDGTFRFKWDALDAWFEEDEQVYVHPRNPYTRVDVLRSSRAVRVELDGELLAESSSALLLFETGLPTRYYFDRTAVRFEHLAPSETVTACPYKGTTSEYWSARHDPTHTDLAWSYHFPTREVLPIAGLVAFYNERVDVSVDGERFERPQTPFSS
jgi:uncharacterized protein (DUF427 family)